MIMYTISNFQHYFSHVCLLYWLERQAYSADLSQDDVNRHYTQFYRVYLAVTGSLAIETIV